MAGPPRRARAGHAPLSRERVLEAAIAVADDEGLDAVSMRRLGRALGVEAMSLYNHVGGKADLLGGMLDLLVDGVPRATERPDWRSAVREQALAARVAILVHPWLAGLVIARSPASAAVLRYADHVMGLFLAGGVPNQVIHDGMHVLGGRILGFVQDIFDPNEARTRLAGQLQELSPERYPRLFQAIQGVRHQDEEEFVFGLDLILDGLERRRIERLEETP